MTRALLVLSRPEIRERARKWIDAAPDDTRVEFKEPKRTLPQNDKMWGMLTDVSVQCRHHTLRLTPDDWKLLFLDGLKREVRMVPNLDGNGLVSLGRSSSDLSKAEMSDMMTLMEMYGARHGVVFSDSRELAA